MILQVILKSSWRVVFYVWWEIELLLGDWKITTVLRELTVEVKVVLAKRRVCAMEWTSCCFMDTVSTVSIVFQIRVRKEKTTRKSWLSKSWRRVSALRWLVHSLEADCWSKIYLICQKTLFGSPGCFGLLPQERKYRASVLLRCPLRVFYCWNNLLGHTWRNEEWWELEIVMIPSVCRKYSVALLSQVWIGNS